MAAPDVAAPARRCAALGASGRNPTKTLSILKRRCRARGRHRAWRAAERGSGYRSVGGWRRGGLDEGAGGGEQWFDGFVTENDERGHRPQAVGKCFIAARAADSGDDVLAAQLFQVIGGLAGTVLCVVLVTGGTHPTASPPPMSTR